GEEAAELFPAVGVAEEVGDGRLDVGLFVTVEVSAQHELPKRLRRPTLHLHPEGANARWPAALGNCRRLARGNLARRAVLQAVRRRARVLPLLLHPGKLFLVLLEQRQLEGAYRRPLREGDVADLVVETLRLLDDDLAALFVRDRQVGDETARGEAGQR